MKICLVSEFYPPRIGGGGEHDAEKHAQNLAKGGHVVHILTAHPRYTNPIISEPATMPPVHENKKGTFIHRILGLKTLKFHEIDLSTISNEELFHVYSLLAIVGFVKNNSFDIVHAFNVHSVLASVIAAKICRVPVVVTYNSFGRTCPKGDRLTKEQKVCEEPLSVATCLSCYSSCGHAYREGKLDKIKLLLPVLFARDFISCFLFRACLRRCNKIIAISSSVKNILIRFGLPSKKIEIVPSIVDLEISDTSNDQALVRQKLGFGLNDRIILFNAFKFDSSKGSDFMIEAMPYILKEFSSAKLVIVGRVPQREMDLLKKKRLLENVVIVGRVPIQEIPNFYAIADVVVWLERRGVGRVLVEAMSFKKPIVASRSSTIMDVVKDGQNALLVDPSNSEELAKAVIRILRDEKFARKLGEVARKTFDEKFSTEAIVQKTVEIYNQLLAK